MRLRLWRTDLLAVELKEKQVSEVEKVGYFLALGLVGVLFGGGGSIRLLSQDKGWVVLGATLLIYLGGVIWVFTVNQAGDGLLFLERFICLSVPAYIRMLLLLYGSYYLLAVAARGWVAANQSSLFFALTMVSSVAFYRWIGQGMALAAGSESAER